MENVKGPIAPRPLIRTWLHVLAHLLALKESVVSSDLPSRLTCRRLTLCALGESLLCATPNLAHAASDPNEGKDNEPWLDANSTYNSGLAVSKVPDVNGSEASAVGPSESFKPTGAKAFALELTVPAATFASGL
jgi:hypothetical protein